MSEIELRDAILRHSLQILRLSAGEQAEVDAVILQLSGDLKTLLQSQVLSEAGKREVEALIKDAEGLIGKAYKTAGASADTYGIALVIADKTFGALAELGPSALVPSPERIAALTKDVMIEGAPSSAWWAKQSEDTAFKFAGQVRQGVINGETNERIVQRIVGKQGEPGIMDVSRRNARTLVHSSIMSAMNEARLATYRKNSKFIKGVRWLATLDGITCNRCAALDGNAWDLDGKAIDGTKVNFMAPPIHFGDRCILSPIPKNTLGIDLGEDTRASAQGPITGDTSFDAFLKRMTPEQIELQFGKGRAELLRSGRITVKDLVSGTGRELTLDELRALSGTDAPVVRATATKVERFTSPINPDVTAETIKVESRLVVQKRLAAQMSEANKDARYLGMAGEFRGTLNKVGKASLPGEFTDEAASLIGALMPELDALASAFRLPKLRGIHSISSAYANMGDGVLGLNPNQFNSYAARLGGKDGATRVAALQAKQDAMKADIEALRAQLTEVRTKRRDFTTKDPEWLDLYSRETDLIRDYNASLKPYDKVFRELNAAKKVNDTKVSTWKPGDNVADRPFVSTDYFEGIDKARSDIYHEFGHHVHQMYNKTQRRTRAYTPPVEIELAEIFKRNVPIRAKSHLQRTELFKRQATTYGTTDEQEWFAENFAFYMMKRKDLVDPEAMELIERLLNDK